MDACQLHALWLYLREHYWHCLQNSTKCVPTESEHTHLEYSKGSASPRRPINARQEGPMEVCWLSTSRELLCLTDSCIGGYRETCSAWGVRRMGNQPSRLCTGIISLRGTASLIADQVSHTHAHTNTQRTITKLCRSVNNTHKLLCKHRKDNWCFISLREV